MCGGGRTVAAPYDGMWRTISCVARRRMCLPSKYRYAGIAEKCKVSLMSHSRLNRERREKRELARCQEAILVAVRFV